MTSPERDALIIEHRLYALKLARAFLRRCPSSVEADDVIGAAMLGLTLAADRFRKGCGDAPFMGVAKIYIRAAMADERHRNDWIPWTRRQRHRKVARLRAKGVSDEAICEQVPHLTRIGLARLDAEIVLVSTAPRAWRDGEAEAIPVYPTADSALDRADRRYLIRLALAGLRPRERRILGLLYGSSLDQNAVAAQLGMEAQAVNMARFRALRRLRSRLERFRGVALALAA